MNFDLNILKQGERTALQLRALAERAGYRKYHMGRFEEYGLYQDNRSFLTSEQVLTFTDLDGRLLALKPDVTLSIIKKWQKQLIPMVTARLAKELSGQFCKKRAIMLKFCPSFAQIE